MADTFTPKSAAEIRKEAEALLALNTLHQGFGGRVELEIAVHHALATYHLAEQFAALRELITEVTEQPPRPLPTPLPSTPISQADLEKLKASGALKPENLGPIEVGGAAAGSAQTTTGEQAAQPGGEQTSEGEQSAAATAPGAQGTES
jgi:hypothetical protein